MNRQEALNHELCPQWLKDAQWEGEVELSDSWPFVIWKDGVWEDGVWEDGTWEGGTWKDGIWKGGIWKGGIWKDGIWRNAIWKDGIWKNGIWRNGIWENGIWRNGIWEKGIWKDGTWRNGYKSIGQCYWRVYYSTTHVRIGCITKTINEWRKWFDSDEVYEHKRDSEQFKKIKQAYLMALAAIEIEKGE